MHLELSVSELEFDKKTEQFTFSFETEGTPNLSFAYYIYKNNVLIDSVWYQSIQDKVTTISYKPLASGKYHFKVFVKDKSDEKIIESTNKVFVDMQTLDVISKFYKNEEIFYLDDPVKYMFQPSKSGSPYLLVVFSGLHTNEYEGGSPVYNYGTTLSEFDFNKLFILDEYKGQFCYYLGHNGRHDFEKAVIALITKTANSLNIPAKNIIASGSSKGGTAALYYSIKYQFGTVISGAPQIFIVDFLKSIEDEPIKRGTTNLTNGEKREAYINNLLMNTVIDSTSFPTMYLHVGEGDYHYKDHLVPFLKELNKKKASYVLDLQPYSNHGLTGTYFKPFFENTLRNIEK